MRWKVLFLYLELFQFLNFLIHLAVLDQGQAQIALHYLSKMIDEIQQDG